MQQVSGKTAARQMTSANLRDRADIRQRPRGGTRPVPPVGDSRAVKSAAKPGTVSKAVGASKKTENPNRIKLFTLQGRIDIPMLVLILVLLAFGITMMFSAGHAIAYEDKSDSFYYVRRQIISSGIGFAGMIILCFVDYRFLRHELKFFGKQTKITLSHILLAAMILLNLMCIPFGVSNIENGPKRWLKIPVFGTFQPSDFLKVAIIIFMAYYIHKSKDRIRSFSVGLLKPGLLLGVLILVMMAQSHLSGLLIIFMVMAAMLFVGGVNIKPALVLLPIAALAIYLAVELSDFVYYFDRIKYMDPLSDPGNLSYQNYQSALAVGSGGIWGKGFGNSSQKYFYLPEAPNDFVYAILVEEFGLVGGVMVILMFMLFVMRGFQIARCAEDKFGCLIVTGITFQIGLQALLNIGVNLCCIPNTGISLPFFSYGGTALMIQLWEMGLLLSVSKRAKLK